MGAGHSKLSPSGATRWASCTASVSFIEENAHLLNLDESSEYADEGTDAHAVADSLIRYATERRGVKIVEARNPEMGRLMVDYSRWALRDVQPGEVVRSERKVPLFYKREDNGTVDVTILGLPKRVIIRDLKYGVGVSVDAGNNDQLAIYAESVIKEWEGENEEYAPADMPVTIELYQPRDMHNSDPVRSWTLKRWELANFTKRYTEAVALIRAGRVAFSPSPKACRWCPAKGICKAYATQGLSILNDEETSVDTVLAQPRFELPNPKVLTREQRQRIVAGRKVLEQWLEAVEDQEVHELMTGAEPMEYKLVEGKTNRVWANEDVAQDRLRHLGVKQEDAMTMPVIKSVAQIEKLFPKEKMPDNLTELVLKPVGKPTLVPVADKRPALVINPTEGFVDLDSDGSEYV